MRYELRCRECNKSWGNQPKSICDDCFSPLEVFYDYDSLRSSFTREKISQGPPSMWRYSDLLPLPPHYQPTVPAGFTPLLKAPHLARDLGAKNLYLKNDAVCVPTLSFKDRVVAVALAQARVFGFDTVACSSTGNLANSVAAQAARNGFRSWIFIPADLEPAKIIGTQVGVLRRSRCFASEASALLRMTNSESLLQNFLSKGRQRQLNCQFRSAIMLINHRIHFDDFETQHAPESAFFLAGAVASMRSLCSRPRRFSTRSTRANMRLCLSASPRKAVG